MRNSNLQTTLRSNSTKRVMPSIALLRDYDGPRGNNALIRDMRSEMWRMLDATFTPGSRLMDLGCGTGLDAVRMARAGHHVTATDWSHRMVDRTRQRAEHEQLTNSVHAIAVGCHELFRIQGHAQFDGAYSNLGALNCVPDLAEMAEQCARLLKPRAALVFSVIGRICPWEIGYYALKRNWTRLRVRFAPGNGACEHEQAGGVDALLHATRVLRRVRESIHPGALAGPMRARAAAVHDVQMREKHVRLYERLWRLDRRAAGWPVPPKLGRSLL